MPIDYYNKNLFKWLLIVFILSASVGCGVLLLFLHQHENICSCTHTTHTEIQQKISHKTLQHKPWYFINGVLFERL